MKAAVFHKPKDIRIETWPDPRIQDSSDAIIRVTASSICGSDLHIYNGMVPQYERQILGHEVVGVVEDIGSGVTLFRRGDRVVVPFLIACGKCFFCRAGQPADCELSNPEFYGPDGEVFIGKGGGIMGFSELYGGYAGGQAELVRVPYADFGLRRIPDTVDDETALFACDVLPAGWSAIEWAELKGGETVAVFGAGPVGLMAMKSARLHGAARVIAIDIQPYRLEMARVSAHAEPIDPTELDVVDAIRARTGGRGADVCVDAVGMEADRSFFEKVHGAIHVQRGTIKALSLCVSSVRRGGMVSIVGAYTSHYDQFPMGQIFEKGIRLRAGQVPVHKTIDKLLALLAEGKLRVDDILTHRFSLDQTPRAFKMFNLKQDGCVKVVIKP